MKVSTVTLALAATADAALLSRSTATILTDLQTIGTNTQALISKLNAFTGGIGPAVQIDQASTALDGQVKQTISDAKGTTGPVSDQDADEVLSAVNSLIPQVVSALNDFVAKDPLFASAGVGQVASAALSQLSTDTNSLATALISIAPSDKQSAASAAASCINSAFGAAVAGSTATQCAGATGSGGGSSAAPSGSSSAPMTSGPSSTGGSSSAAAATGGSSTGSAPASTSSGHSGAGASYTVGGSFAAVVLAAFGLVL